MLMLIKRRLTRKTEGHRAIVSTYLNYIQFKEHHIIIIIIIQQIEGSSTV